MKSKGSSLILVLCLLAIISILGGAAVSTSYSTQLITIHQINNQQAYFTARSAVDTTIKYIQKYSNDSAKMSALTSNIGNGTISGMGNYSVTVTNINSNSIKVQATAAYKSGSSTVTAYLTKAASVSAIIPTDYTIYVDGNVNNGNLNPGTINGPVYVNGSFYLSYGSKILGKLIAKDDITITGGSATTNGVIGFGDVSLDGGGAINGDVSAKGNLSFGGGTVVNGKAQCDGNLNMPQGTINGDTNVGGNVSFSGGAPKISNSGKLYYQGSLSYAWGSISDWVPAGTAKTTSYTGVDLGSYNDAALPIITAPNITNNAVLTNKTISGSGIITSAMFSSLSYGDVVTIDTTSQDINLIVDNTTFDPEKGLDFEVTGPHNLYIYLTGSSSFIVGSNQFIGMKNHNEIPKIFIIGDSTQSVSLSNCEVDANIYIPLGSFSASGGAPSTYMLQGTCIVKSISVASQISMNYLKPTITGSPLEILSSGASGGSWNIERWANN